MELLLLRASLARFSERDLEAVLGSSPNPQETEQGNIPGQGLSVSAPKSSEILAAVAKVPLFDLFEISNGTDPSST